MPLLKLSKLEIDKLFKRFKQEAKGESARLLKEGFSTQPVDRARMELCLRTLYQALGRDEPAVFWCDSPFQSFAIPYLIDRFATESDIDFETFWQRAEEQYFSLCGQSLLNSLNVGTLQSRLSKHFPLGCGYRPQEAVLNVPQIIDDLNRKSAACTELQKDSRSINFEVNDLSNAYQMVSDRLVIDLNAAPAMQDMGRYRSNPSQPAVERTDHIAVERDILAFLRGLTRFGEVVADGIDPGHIDQLISWKFGAFGNFSALSNYSLLYNLAPITDEPVSMATRSWAELVQSLWWVNCYANSVFLADRPSLIRFDQERQLHCIDGPAIKFADGYEQYFLNGASVPSYIVKTEPTVEMIEHEPNIELRRIMLNRFGTQNFLFATGAKVAHVDETGTLYRKEMPGEEPIMMVHVVNKTPESDGNFHDFFIRVPPQMSTAREAIAWTFGLTAEEYEPLQET